ncbi:MAG: hypothetical protein K6E49_05535 [Lachnospiraceae bacterium]|nr:hypothetical protein [Lachnospiraceae bacterium]
MDPEEERVLYLARAGNSKIFKYGTYNMVQDRAITQDHPFYVKREDGLQKVSYIPPQQASQQAADDPRQNQTDAGTQSPAMETQDPEELAAAVISNNFKVGLSQEEVDALLNGM